MGNSNAVCINTPKESNPSHHDVHRVSPLRERLTRTRRRRRRRPRVVVGRARPTTPAMELVQQGADLRVPVLRREEIAGPCRVPERDVELRQGRRGHRETDGDGCAVRSTASACARASERRRAERRCQRSDVTFVSGGRIERGRVPSARRLRLRSAGRHSPPPRCVRTRTREERRHVVIVALVAPEGTRPARVHQKSHNLDVAPGARVVQARLAVLVSRGEQRVVRVAQRARGVDVPLLTRAEGAPTRRDPPPARPARLAAPRTSHGTASALHSCRDSVAVRRLKLGAFAAGKSPARYPTTRLGRRRTPHVDHKMATAALDKPSPRRVRPRWI